METVGRIVGGHGDNGGGWRNSGEEWRNVEEKKERTSAEQPAEVVSVAAKEVDSKETDLEFENNIDAWASLPACQHMVTTVARLVLDQPATCCKRTGK